MIDQQEENQRIFRRDGFTFKQFFVAHDRCAMKVGTDGVLLGAWAPLDEATCILDIGSGSGLISLMLAQRSSPGVRLEGVELDKDAVLQSRENVQASPWEKRITIHHEDIRQYASRLSAQFDLIVSNPPYFSPGSVCRDEAREKARYTSSLTHDTLLDCAERLLAPGGRFCMVLPYDIGLHVQLQAENSGWQTGRRLIVRDNPQQPPHRLLFELGRCPLVFRDKTLSIKHYGREYSGEFGCLMKDFYLFF